MKFQCSQDEFAAALGMVGRAISSRSTGHPILSNVLIVADSSRITLTAFDLSIGIRVTVAATVETPGTITLPARTLSEIVTRLPNEAILFDLQEQMVIATSRGRYKIMGMPSEEYPDLPTPQGEAVEIPASALITGIRSTASICSTDETKQVLTGVHLTARGQSLEFAATDGHRLARYQFEAQPDDAEPEPWDFEVTIPARAMRDLEKLLAPSKEDDTVALYFDQGQLLFHWGDQCLTTRTLDGQYPNYNQLIPQRFALEVVADRKQLIAAIDRVATLADHKNNVVKLGIDVTSQSVLLSVETVDVGSGREALDAQIQGGNLEIAFNCKYLQDGLKISGSAETKISLSNATAPVIIEPLGADRVLYLVMPVQVRS
jgi:DNA polymerase-3 subunit beta